MVLNQKKIKEQPFISILRKNSFANYHILFTKNLQLKSILLFMKGGNKKIEIENVKLEEFDNYSLYLHINFIKFV